MRGTLREMAAEFLGTFVLVVFGRAVVAQVLLSNEKAGQYLSINLGWGLAVTMGMFIAGGVSGAHLNPAVTLSFAVQTEVPLAESDSLLDRTGGGRFCRGVGHVSRIYRSPVGLRFGPSRCAGDGRIADRLHLGDLSVAPSQHGARRIDRSDRRDGPSDGVHLRDHRRPQYRGAINLAPLYVGAPWC